MKAKILKLLKTVFDKEFLIKVLLLLAISHLIILFHRPPLRVHTRHFKAGRIEAILDEYGVGDNVAF